MASSRFFPLVAALGVLSFSGGATSGQSMESARTAYEDGRFVEAADIAESIGTAEAYILAARSLSTHAYYEASEEDWEAVIQRAMRMGEEAIRADSSGAEAYFSMVSAVGRYAQGKSAWTALREGLGGRIKDLLEIVLEIDPDHIEGLTALGCWHADVAAQGRVARMIYGGKRKEAVALFDRALALAPDDKDLLLQYGARLPDLDRDRGVARAREMLERAVGLPVRDAQANYVHFEILDALDTLDEG